MRAIGLGFLLLLTVVVGCGDNKDADTDAAAGHACSDHIDNDGDGMIDFPDDLGCESADSTTEDGPIKPACQDNRDNDGDGKIDYPNDPGCPAPQADDEADPCPDGAGCPQCGDGQDNDGNGKIDFPDDPGCSSAYDNIEFTDNPNACGQGMVIKQLPAGGIDSGALIGTTSSVSSPCGGGNGLPAVAYVFHLSTPKVIVATTDDSMTMIDTILDLRSSMCSTPSAELACHDDLVPNGTGANKKSTVTKSLGVGTYYLIVGGKTMADTGNYLVNVQFLPGTGTSCTSVADCGPGLECRIPTGQTSMICIGPVCDDGIDDDGDGKTDYPNDPGCATPTDSTENDVCNTTPNSPQCPACSNGLDDDGDGAIDYPNDSSCFAASTPSEACQQSEAPIIATMPQTMGTTAGAVNDYRPPPGTFNGSLCSTTFDPSATAPDVTVQFDVPAMDSLALRLNPVAYDSTQILFGSSCTAPLDCQDNPDNMLETNLAGGRYYLIVDGYTTSFGTFTLNISGNIKNGQSCESALAQSGAITCNAGYACLGSPGSRTCAPTECNDGVDNNGDGRMDYPADPGCQNKSDLTENTVCPGANCPACADGIDNDNDTKTDYPADTACVSASGINEGCTETDALIAITAQTTMGTLVGTSDDHDPNCVTSNLPDRIYTLTLPTTLQSLTIDTTGSAVDTVLSLMTSSCMEPALACDDDSAGNGDSLITRGSTPAGTYMIAVDAKVTPLDTFNINVKGTIAPGGSCEGALFQAGVLVCPTNFGCNGPAGSRTCSAAQCLDGVDNNGDGRTDYPNDPSCDSPSDNSEVTVCPGPSCPVCADGIDNDGDGKTDYPADPRCTAASGTNEGCIDTDAIGTILLPVTTGTLVGKANDHQPSCIASVGPDVIYTLTVPALESLTIDTNNSTVDTVLSFMSSDCNEPALACTTTGGIGSGDAKITRQFVQAGTYTIAIDAPSTTTNTFVLDVDGVISPGASCESPLVATGALHCSLGFACDGPVGARTCRVAQCIDGVDNNGDGKTDFPADPGCTSFSDNTETTVCPGPSCPVCADGLDNDGDGATDYPADTSCFSASATNESCTQSEAIGTITQMVTNGTTTGQVNDYTPVCGTTTGHSAPDLIYQLDLPAMTTLSLNLVSQVNLTTTLLNATCGGTPVACSDPPLMSRTNVAAGTYYVVIDGYSTENGPWTLTTTGTIAANESCEGPLFQAGAFTCTTGYQCGGTPGSRTCIPTPCNDGSDNDGDGKMDYPADPGCTSVADTNEADDCSPTVGPNCPACANGLDDDTDGMTDYPADTRCLSASFFVENFCPTETDIAGMVLEPSSFNTLAGKTNDFTQSCQPSTGNDITYGLHLPVAVSSLQIDTIGSPGATDTIVSLWNAACSGSNLGCDDDGDPAGNLSLMVVSNVPAGNYAIQVDAYGPNQNLPIRLNVRGTVAPGSACTDPLFATGVLVCATGTSCNGATCQ